MDRYEKNKELVLKHIKEMLPKVQLLGQWSVDIMQNGDVFYLIDMALAKNSALNDCVPKMKLKRKNGMDSMLFNVEFLNGRLKMDKKAKINC